MKKEDFLDMCKRMVIEYYNRYVHFVDNPTIIADNVNLVEDNSNDDILEALLMVDIDPWLQYKVIYDPSKKNKKDQCELISYVIFT